MRVAHKPPRWSHQFDYEFAEPLYIETDAATEIANMVHTVLEPATRKRVQKADSMDLYLRGLAESNVHTAEGLDRIFQAFDEGMKKDPSCAPPYAALARLYERGANLGLLKPTDAYAKARAAAQEAIELDPASDGAHSSLAELYARDKRYAEAINETTTAFFLRGQRDQALKIKATYEKSGYEAARQVALREQLNYLLNQREKHFVSAFDIAAQYVKLGDRQQSLAWLQTAYEQRDVGLLCLGHSQNDLFAFVN